MGMSKKRDATLERLAELMEMGYTFTFDGDLKTIYVDQKMHWHVDAINEFFTKERVDLDDIKIALFDSWWEENCESSL
jgi:hypothetical protein